MSGTAKEELKHKH